MPLTPPSATARQRLERAPKRGHHAIGLAVLANGVCDVAGCAADGPPPEDRALFEIGSISKAITGVLLADMHLRGEVDLADPLSRHLPHAGPSWRGREPTLLDLATHRSGLPNTPRSLIWGEMRFMLGVGDRDPWEGIDAEAYRGLLRRMRPRGPRGSHIRYSSIGFGLLGDALAAAADRPFETLLRERVLDPLGMHATGIAPRGPMLQGHAPRGQPRPPIRDPMPAAGSVRSNLRDMTALLAACLAPGPLAPGPALALAQRPVHRVNRGFSIGLGWMIATRPGEDPVIVHTGGTWGFASFAGFSPSRGRAAVALANTARPVQAIGWSALTDQAQTRRAHASGAAPAPARPSEAR